MPSESGEVRWRLTDVIGLEDGLGVECLSGSGAIAGAYCKSFREVCPRPWQFPLPQGVCPKAVLAANGNVQGICNAAAVSYRRH